LASLTDWPTEAEITRFTDDYATAIDRWVALVIASAPDMEDPHTLHGQEVFDEVAALCAQSDGHARAAYCLLRHYDPLRAPWGFDYYPTHVACLDRVRSLNAQARDTLHRWWVTSSSVDYRLPSALADNGPGTSSILATFTYREKRYRKVERVGQFVLLREDAPGFEETQPGTLFIEASSARLLSYWKASYGGGLPAARQCARALSSLTDWRLFDAFTPGQRRAAGIRVKEILCEQCALAGGLPTEVAHC
jgi:hypothetical protein